MCSNEKQNTESMKKIIIIEPSGNLYGSEMVLLDILKNLNRNKYDISIILPNSSPFCNILDKYNIKYYDILNIKNSIQKLKSYIKLYKIIKLKKPDLIFINQAGIQRIVSHFTNYLKIPIVSEVSTLEDGLLINKFSNHLLKPVKTFICNSKFIATQLQTKESNKSVLYYGYEWKDIKPVIPQNKSPFKVLLLGRICESKGHFLLVEAINLLIQKQKNINIEIHFWGNAPSLEIEEDIKSRIKNYNLKPIFKFNGFNTDLNVVFEDMNLMVIPSIQEPFGRIFCETAEAKLPCLVADSGGLGELSKRFDLGIRFKGRDANDLADKIEYCYQNYESIKNDFQTKAHSFLERLEMTEYIKKIEFILDEAIENKDVAVQWFGK